MRKSFSIKRVQSIGWGSDEVSFSQTLISLRYICPQSTHHVCESFQLFFRLKIIYRALFKEQRKILFDALKILPEQKIIPSTVWRYDFQTLVSKISGANSDFIQITISFFMKMAQYFLKIRLRSKWWRNVQHTRATITTTLRNKNFPFSQGEN